MAEEDEDDIMGMRTRVGCGGGDDREKRRMDKGRTKAMVTERTKDRPRPNWRRRREE